MNVVGKKSMAYNSVYYHGRVRNNEPALALRIQFQEWINAVNTQIHYKCRPTKEQ